MRVLLLGFGKIAYMPYMNFYLESLNDVDGIEFDLVYWDRDGKPDAPVPEPIHTAYKFEAHLEEQLPFKRKLRFFIRYRWFVKRILRKTKYERIIVLHTTPGLTLLDYLRKNYLGRYILDFRDISYEYKPLYRKLVGLLATGSAITYVSSNAFRKYLPKLEYIYTIHNYLEDSLNYRMLRKRMPRNRSVIRISYWGLVRQIHINTKFMDALGNDPRFELHYYGRMQQDGRDMESYAKEKHYSNIYFHGQYLPNERYSFALQTDMIHNVYDLGYTTGNAMGNKYYDGIIFSIPQICSENSYMGDVVKTNGVGMTVDVDGDNIADSIWDYYKTIDWARFEADCEKQMGLFIKEQSIASDNLKSLFTF